MRRDVRALTARTHPEGRLYPMRRHALYDQVRKSEGTNLGAADREGALAIRPALGLIRV